MPNPLTTRIREILARQGLQFDGSDDDLTMALGQLGRPELAQQADFSADYRAIREANSPGTFGGLANTAKTAYDRSVQALNVGGGIDATDAEDIAERERRIQERPVSVAWEDWQRSEGPDAVRVFLRDPIEIVSNIVTAGFAGSLPALAGGLTGGAAGVAAGGPAAPVTGAIGAALGTGAGSLAVEYGSKYLDVLREAGADLTDPDSITRVVSDPGVQERARELALRRGIPVAAFDAVSAGLAGRFLKGLRGASAGQSIRRGAAEAAIQGGAGGGGEVAGALSAGEEIRPGAVFEEIVGELGPGAVEVGGAALRRRMAERGAAPAPMLRRPVTTPQSVSLTPESVVETPAPSASAPVTPSPARRVALMTDEQRAARFAELSDSGRVLAGDEQQELELLRAFVGEAAAVAAPVPGVVEQPTVEPVATPATQDLAPPTEVSTLFPVPVPEPEPQPQILDPARESEPDIVVTGTPALSDAEQYQAIRQRLEELGADQFGSPEYQQLWQQSEEIKNRHGGIPPVVSGVESEVAIPEAAISPAPAAVVAEIATTATPTAPAVALPPTVAQVAAVPAIEPSLPSGQPAPVVPELTAVPPAPQPSPTLEDRLRTELTKPEPFTFGKVIEGDGLTVDLRDDPRFDALTPEMAKRLPVAHTLDETGNRAKTRVAVVLEAPDGSYVQAGLLAPKERTVVGGSGNKDTGPAVQKMAEEKRAGGYQKLIKEGGKQQALLSDVIAAGYKLRAIVHFDGAPGNIFQRFTNRSAFDASYAATERTTGATPAQKVIPSASQAQGIERKSIITRRDVIQRGIDSLSDELQSADPARAAEINDDIQQLYAELRRLPEPRLGTETPAPLAFDGQPLPAQADRAQEFALVAARLRQNGAQVDVFPKAFFQQTLETHLRGRLDEMIALYQRAPEATQEDIQTAIERVQAQIASIERVRGVTYDASHIAVGLDDVEHANLAGLVWLLHEGGHAILGRDPAMQARVIRAVNGAMEDVRAELTAEQERSGVREARLDDAEELIVSTVAQKLANEGMPDAPSLARAIWQWVKDLYFRTAMAVQATFGREPSGALAMGWFENQVRRVVGGDFDYRVADIFKRFSPEPVASQVTRQIPTGGTPGGITDYFDSLSNTVRQPEVLEETADAVRWNLRLGTQAAGEQAIERKEATARIMAAALNEINAMAEAAYADAARTRDGLTFDQWWAQVGRGETPKMRLAVIAQEMPGAEAASIGGERMTDAMNGLARVKAKEILIKWESTANETAVRTEESAEQATKELNDRAKLTNKLEGDLRNAELHEANFRDQLKAQVRELVRSYRAGLGTAAQSGALAQAVRDAEGLAQNDPLPSEYEALFRRVLADEVPLFSYVDAISKLDLSLADLTRAEFYAAVEENAASDPVLGRLAEPRNRPLMVALGVLLKKNAEQVDILQLRRADAAKFLAIHGDLKAIREAPEARLREIERTIRADRKATTFADRIKRSYVEKRARMRRNARTIQEAEERAALVAETRTAIAAKINEIETNGLPAPSEWRPSDGANYLAMYQDESGAWKSRARTLKFTREGPEVNGEQVRSDLAGNREYLRENRERAGAKTYQLVLRQTEEMERIDVFRKYPEIQRVFFEKWLLPSADMILSGGGAGAARAAQMLKKFQFITFSNWEEKLFRPALAWSNRLNALAKSSGLNDAQRFLGEVYDPVLYFIQTEPGLEEGPAIREAVRAAGRRLAGAGVEVAPAFDDQFRDFLQQTKAMSESFLKVAEDNGLFIEDQRLGGELRRAVARGWLTVMRRMNANVVSTVLREMDGAGWTLDFKDENGAVGSETFDRGVARGRRVVSSTTFDGLMPWATEDDGQAQARTAVMESPQLLGQAIGGFFTPGIIQRWLLPFVNKPGEPVFTDSRGEKIEQLDVQAAWAQGGGDVVAFIDALGKRAGLRVPEGDAAEAQLTPEGEWRASMLRQISGLYEMEAKIAADANQVKGLFDPRGRPAHLLMDARENDLLPPEHIEHMGFDPISAKNLLATLAFHAAFGRNGVAMVRALEEVKGDLLARKSAFYQLPGSTVAAKKQYAKDNDLDYDSLKRAAKVYSQVGEGMETLEAAFGFGNQAGMLGDVRTGLQLLHFIATQTTNTPKTGLLNILQLTQRMIARRTIDPVALRDTGRAGGEMVKQFFGQALESFGLHLWRASQHARDVGGSQGVGFGQLPWTEVLGVGAGKRGEEQPTAIKVMRTALGLQRKGARIGFGESREFPRMANVPFLSNTMQGIGLAAAISNGTAEANSVESLVLAAMQYFAANPEAMNDPSFQLTAKDLRAESAAWFKSPGSFDYFRRSLVDYGIGNLEDVARGAMERSLEGQPILTQEQVLKAAMMANNELDLQGSINTNPAVWSSNPILKFATPLLGWPIRQMNQIHGAMRGADGRATAASSLRALGILAAWSLPVGLAFTFLTDEYDERIIKKKSNLGGIGTELTAKENALAILQRLSRAGNIYGLGIDFVSTGLAGLDPTSGQRAFSLDSRILAFSQLRTFADAIQSYINSGFNASFAGVERPLIQAIGGNGALHAIDIFNGVLGLDNQEARLTRRTNAQQWLRAAGREAGLELRRGGGGSATATPVGTWTREMLLASMGNDRMMFLEAYRRAVDAAREAGAENPEQKVMESWRSRNPLEVFRFKPNDQDLTRTLNAMSDSGRDAVRDALRLYEQYTALIAPSQAETYQRRVMSQMRAQVPNVESLRRRMANATLSPSLR